MIKGLIAFMIIFWMVAGIYFGVGGITLINASNDMEKTLKTTDTSKGGSVIYDKIPFKNIQEVKNYISSKKNDNIKKWMFYVDVPDFLSMIITGCSFGMLGTIISILYSLAFGGAKLDELKIFSQPLLGMMIGLMVMAISYLIPSLLKTDTATDNNINPLSLMFFCLFAGIYSKDFYERVASVFKTKFLTEDKK